MRQACVVGGNGAHGVSAAASSTEIREAADGGDDLDAQFSSAVAFILSSPEYQALQQNLIKEVQGAVDELKDRMMRLKSQRDENRNSMEVEMDEEYEPWDDLARVATRNSEYVRDDDGGGTVRAIPDESGADGVTASPSSVPRMLSSKVEVVQKGHGVDDGGGSLDGDDSGSLDRFSQVSFGTLPQYEKIPQICEDMHVAQPESKRRAAAIAIGEFPAGDLLHSEFWPNIRKGITSALHDPIDELKGVYMTLLWKLYRDAAPVQTGEVYMCLLTHLLGVANRCVSRSEKGLVESWKCFERLSPLLRQRQKANANGSVSLGESICDQAAAAEAAASTVTSGSNPSLPSEEVWGYIVQVHFLNAMQRDFPRHQVYFPDALLAKIAICTFNLLQVTSDDRSAVNPGGSTDGLGFAEMLAVATLLPCGLKHG